MTTKSITDPGLYRRLSEPFENEKDFTSTAGEFATELRALRERHGFPDLVYIISANVKDGEGEKIMMTFGNCGDYAKVAPILANTLNLCVKDEVDRLVGMLPTGKADE